MLQKTIEVTPDPKRVIEGLRDTGYQFEAAIADIVDNSLAAEATTVKVQVEMEVDGRISVFVSDNGKGMNQEDLINAMKYGSQTRVCALSLCKFGLGLKTASTAFCRRLSVVSRDDKSSYQKATWDLDHVAEVGKWDLLLSQPTTEEIQRLKKVTGEHSGTLVIWEKVDRLIKHYASPNGRHAQVAINSVVKDLREALPMIFQRFLDQSYPGTPKVEISVNDVKLDAWNPFVPEESSVVGKETLQIENPEDGTLLGSINVVAYVLPRREDFVSQDLARQARISNDYQGIYVYREDRLIYGPNWFNLYSKEPHFSLIRVAFSFNHDLDRAFHIDIKKSQVICDEALTDWLRDTFLPSPRRAAEQTYRKGYKKKIVDEARSIHTSSNKAISSRAEAIVESTVEAISSERVQVTNREGISRIRLKVSEPATPDEIRIKPVESIEDGLLWEPTVMNNKLAVAINQGHDYYSKVYIPNKHSGVIVQGLDSLLWALSEAEMETVNEQNHRYFLEMRYHVSKILRLLSIELPDPPETEE
ncbi:MAG: ATP-binding protein [Candidatus Bathyarchaeota archaeon]|nr:ATP-binding protein [Candidatus Bathyarchaeota archaeon]